MNQDKILKIKFEQNLLKVKYTNVIKTKELLSHLRKVLNIPAANKLILFNDVCRVRENEELTEKEIKLQRDGFILVEDTDYDLDSKKIKQNLKEIKIKDSNILDISSKDNPFLDLNKTLVSKVESKEIPTEPKKLMAEMIMRITGAEKPMEMPIEKEKKRPRAQHYANVQGHGLGLGQNVLDFIMRRFGEGEIDAELIDDDEGEEEGEDEDNDNDSDDEYYSEDEFIFEDIDQRGPYLRAMELLTNQMNPLINPVINPNVINANNPVINPLNPNNRFQALIGRRLRNYDQNLLNTLIDMGFSEPNSRIALRESRNDLNYAASILVNAPDIFFLENQHLAADNAPVIAEPFNQRPENNIQEENNLLIRNQQNRLRSLNEAVSLNNRLRSQLELLQNNNLPQNINTAQRIDLHSNDNHNNIFPPRNDILSLAVDNNFSIVANEQEINQPLPQILNNRQDGNNQNNIIDNNNNVIANQSFENLSENNFVLNSDFSHDHDHGEGEGHPRIRIVFAGDVQYEVIRAYMEGHGYSIAELDGLALNNNFHAHSEGTDMSYSQGRFNDDEDEDGDSFI